jgi:peptidoglycan/LPS O-acetylase OafA/YrhL
MTTSDRIAGFDGLRAIAFLLVFASHKFPIAHRDPFGDVGVWTFFVLSGFLITGILARSREDVEAGRISAAWALARFYLRRTARIFPVYYMLLALALLASVFVTVDNFWGTAKLAYAFYATNIFIGMRSAWLGDFGHLWSLAVEEQFYLLFAPLVLMTPRRWTAALCWGFVGVALATKIVMELRGASNTAIDVNSLINFGLLGFGGLVGLAARAWSAPVWLASGPAQALTFACLLVTPVLFGPSTEAWMTYAKVVGLVAGLLLFQIAQAQATSFVAVLESAPLRLLGRVSYGAYLFHPFIHFEGMLGLAGVIGPVGRAPAPVQILVEFAVTVALATASWVLLERPILRRAALLTSQAPFAGTARGAQVSSAPGGETT